MSKVYRLFLLICISVGFFHGTAMSQICNYSTSICGIDDLVDGEIFTMPDPDNFPNRDQLILDSILTVDRNGVMGSPKLINYFFNTQGLRTICSGGAFSLDNPVIYTLIAEKSNAFINFEFFDCQDVVITNGNGGSFTEKGFQVALIKNCTLPELIICEDNRQKDNATLPITITGATPGDEYYLVIDGYSGSVCDYQITTIDGFVVDNVSPIQTVEYEGKSADTNIEICSSTVGPTLTIKSNNSDALVDSKWRIFNSSGTVVYAPQKSGHFLKLPASVTTVADNYTFDVELISPCSGVRETPFLGSFTIIDGLVSQTLELDICGAEPFDTLGIQITESGMIEVPFNGGTNCESAIRINSQFLHIENPELIQNTCNQIELSGTILEQSEITTQIQWIDENGNFIDNNNSDLRLFNISANQTVGAIVTLTGLNSSCDINFAEINAVYDPPTFPMTCIALNTESIKIDWDEVTGASSYTLLINGNQRSIGAGQSTITIDNLQRESRFDFELIANVGGGCTPTAKTSCTTLLCDSSRNLSITNMNIDSTICVSDPQVPVSLRETLQGQIEAPSVTWFINDVAQADGVFNPANYVNGDYRIRATLDDNGCRAESTEVTFRITGFDSNVGFDIADRVCVNDEVTISLLGTRYDEAVYNLTAEGNANQTGLITQDLSLSWPSAGTYTVSLFLEDNNCRSTQNITKTIIVEQSTGVENVRVNSNSKSATFQWDAVSCADSYIIYLNDVRSEVTSETNYTYVFDAIEDEVNLRVGIESGSCFCPNDSPDAIGSKDLCPNITLDITQVPRICLEQGVNTEPILLEVDIIGKEGEGELEWSGIGVLPDGRFVPNLVDVGTHMITATYTENACPFSESISIEVSQMPDVQYEVIGSACPNESTMLIIEDFENYMVFANDEQLTSAESSLEPGDYVIEFSPIDGCEVFKEITVDPVRNAEIQIAGDKTVREGITLKYSLNTTDFEYEIENILWSYKGELLCESNCKQSIITEEIKSSGQLCAEVSFNTDCKITECIDLDVEPKLKVYVPNSIIHNSINANDRFRVILNQDIAEIEEVSVFDRIGEKVYTESNIQSVAQYKGWDGQNMNDELLSPGVYVYMVKIRKEDGSLELMTGDVTLLH